MHVCVCVCVCFVVTFYLGWGKGRRLSPSEFYCLSRQALHTEVNVVFSSYQESVVECVRISEGPELGGYLYLHHDLLLLYAFWALCTEHSESIPIECWDTADDEQLYLIGTYILLCICIGDIYYDIYIPHADICI